MKSYILPVFSVLFIQEIIIPTSCILCMFLKYLDHVLSKLVMQKTLVYTGLYIFSTTLFRLQEPLMHGLRVPENRAELFDI